MTSNNTLYIKCLSPGGRSSHSWMDERGHASVWDEPYNGYPGRWKTAHTIDIAPHKTGLHVVDAEDSFVYFFTGENFKVELAEKIVDGYDCSVAYKARLIEKYPVTGTQWQKLGLEFADMAQEIPTLLDYPEIFRMPVLQAYQATKSALTARETRDFPAKKKEAAQKLRIVAAQGARHRLDSWNTGEYLYSALAAERSHSAVLGLGQYLLEDDATHDRDPDTEPLRHYLTKTQDWQATKMIAANTAMAWQNTAAQFKFRSEVSGWRHDSKLRDRLAELPANPKAAASTDLGFQVFSSIRLLQNNALLAEIGQSVYGVKPDKTLGECSFFPG